MASFLITGGAGFIGSNFLIKMVKKYPNDFYCCVDKLTYAGNVDNLKSIIKSSNFCFINADICERNTMDNLFSKFKFDYVVNFAAESHVDRSIDDSEVFIKTNVLGVQVLLDLCKKYSVKRFHQISTDEVYGDLPLGSNYSFTENDVLHPSSPYSASKASADLLVLSYHRTFNLPVTISRCSNNFGPYQFLEKFIPLIIDNATSGKTIPVYGNGLNVRDWIYVDDHCDAIDMIVRNGKDGSIYNVGGCTEISNINLVRMILLELGISEDKITYVKDRPGHDLRYSLNSDKIKNELGWKCLYNFEDGLKKTIEWYMSNKNWIEDIKKKS